MSKRCIQVSDWNHVKNSQAVPFYDYSGSIIGCQFILKQNTKDHKFLNLIDQRANNIYSFSSNIVHVGLKEFILSKEDPN